MGIFSRIFQSKPALPSIEHPIFGRMDAVIDHGNGQYFWEMPTDVSTPIGPVSVSLDADEKGPSADQVALWQLIIADFEHYREATKPLLLETMKGFGQEAQYDKLKPSAFGFYNDDCADVDWDISFEVESEGMLYTVCFKAGNPTLVHVDS